MTTHEFAKLLLAQPELALYVSIQGESYYSPNVPRIEEGPDPIELEQKLVEYIEMNYMHKKVGEIPFEERNRAIKQQAKLLESTLPITKYAVVVI